jgi:polysaccharide export outer membrane protein
MNLLFPRYRKQRSRDRRIYPARGGLKTFSLLAVCAIFWSGALGYPPAARAQNDAPPQGSQPSVVPAKIVPDKAAPEGPAPKVETAAPGTQAPEATKVDTPKPDAPKADAPKDAPASSAAGAKAAAPSVGGKAYIIGPNDVLQVKVWNSPQISGMVDVHLDGMISIPLAGEIKAEGLTALQLNDVITRRLEEVALTAPVVDVSVVKINSKHYRVFGGVMKPGEFILAERVTIMTALSQAGGIKEGFAKTNRIQLRRGKDNPLLFNMKDYLKNKNMDKNIDYELQDGDVIVVPE